MAEQQSLVKKHQTAASTILIVIAIGWTAAMIVSLRERFLDRLVVGAYHEAIGADFFGTPRGFRNLMAGSNIYLTELDDYGPYATTYLAHPLMAVAVGSWAAALSPWTAYGLFVAVSLVLLATSTAVLAWQFESKLLKAFTLFALFCSLPTYIMLWNAQLHVLVILAVSLIFADLIGLSLHEQRSPRRLWMLQAGLLISLLSKPVALLALPVLFATRETRRALLLPVAIYAVISLVFLLTPALNSGGYDGFHWLNLLSASSSRNPLFYLVFPRELNLNAGKDASTEIYCLPLFLQRLTGAPVPQMLLKLPLVAVAAMSLVPLFLTSRRRRIDVALATIMLGLLIHFLAYNMVWEYHYTTLLPMLPVLWWMSEHEDERGLRWLLRIAFFVLLANFLPTFYGLDPKSPARYLQASTLLRVVPVLVAFICLLMYGIGIARGAVRERSIEVPRGQLPELGGIGLALATCFAIVLICVFTSVPARLTKSLSNWTAADWSAHWEDLRSRPMPALKAVNLAMIGGALFREGKTAEALPLFERATLIEPQNAEAHFQLSLALCELDRPREALAALERALELAPTNVPILCQTAWVLSTSSDPAILNGARATELARRAIDLSAGREPRAVDTLAAALAETGQFAAAIETAQRALALAQGSGNGPLVSAIEGRLKLYRRHQPCRQPTPGSPAKPSTATAAD